MSTLILFFYSCVSVLLHPLVIVWLKHRARKGKEDTARLGERLGKATIGHGSGKLIWIHAASVGEANSVRPLIEQLHDAHTDVRILVTTGTVTSAKLMMKQLPERAVHVYAPVDTLIAVRRFLKRMKPDLAIWVESEFWPNLLHQTRRRGVPMVLVNARMSQKSFYRWKKVAALLRHMLGWFDAIYAGSAPDMQRLHALGIEKAVHIGNLKYDARPLPYDARDMSMLLEKLGDRRVWIASSTHPKEEEMVAEVHQMIRETYPELLTILVPRHPHRGEEIAQMLKGKKMMAALRSKQQKLIPESDVYVADTLGELGMFYRLAGVVFMGGSLVPHGGHNPIEPAQLDCAVIAGPHMDSFAAICREMEAAEALRRVSDIQGLHDAVVEKLRDHEAQETMAAKAHVFVDSKRGAAHEMHKVIAGLLSLEMPKDDTQEQADESA